MPMCVRDLPLQMKVPAGRPKIAQRFIAGMAGPQTGTSPGGTEERRAITFSFAPPGLLASLKSVYPAMNRWAIFGCPVGQTLTEPWRRQRRRSYNCDNWLHQVAFRSFQPPQLPQQLSLPPAGAAFQLADRLRHPCVMHCCSGDRPSGPPLQFESTSPARPKP
jgi:hypothetical protein